MLGRSGDATLKRQRHSQRCAAKSALAGFEVTLGGRDPAECRFSAQSDR